MGRRSDHTRSELQVLLIEEGWRQLSEVGLAHFSARDVAKRIGYSIGTLYNVFGSYDGLLGAINARTLAMWAAELEARLAEAAGGDRIAALVSGYFAFARRCPKAWLAIFEHHMADWGPAPEQYAAAVHEVLAIVAREIATTLPGAEPAEIARLARSLIATVHGHCVFAVLRTFDMLGETAPEAAALARVREALSAAGAD